MKQPPFPVVLRGMYARMTDRERDALDEYVLDVARWAQTRTRFWMLVGAAVGAAIAGTVIGLIA